MVSTKRPAKIQVPESLRRRTRRQRRVFGQRRGPCADLSAPTRPSGAACNSSGCSWRCWRWCLLPSLATAQEKGKGKGKGKQETEWMPKIGGVAVNIALLDLAAPVGSSAANCWFAGLPLNGTPKAERLTETSRLDETAKRAGGPGSS